MVEATLQHSIGKASLLDKGPHHSWTSGRDVCPWSMWEPQPHLCFTP